MERSWLKLTDPTRILDEECLELVTLEEAARIKIVRARIRHGKIQRRKRVSTIKGYALRKRGNGPPKLVRMSAAERRHRKMGARRAKFKRRAKAGRIRIKLKRSLRKRHNLGI